jgi:hypothetical protein
VSGGKVENHEKICQNSQPLTAHELKLWFSKYGIDLRNFPQLHNPPLDLEKETEGENCIIFQS